MTETLFNLSNTLALPFWLLMVLAPRWRVTERVIGSPWIVAPFAAIYAAMVIPRAGSLLPTLASPQLGGVAALLGTPEGAALGWIHFLAFDLFVGRWIYLDSRERRFSAWLVGPVLLLTLMFGPLGLLVYLTGRAAAGALMRRRGAEVSDALSPAATGRLRSAFRAASAINRPLTYAAVAMLPLLLLAVIGLIVDPRVITGAPAWLKPAKFAASLAVYAFTLLWLLGRVEGHRRLVWMIGTASAAAMAVEWGVIALQAFRGTTSHFNVGTALDGTLFSIMGVFVILLWVANLLAAVLLIRQPATDRAFAWSLRLGLITALVGGAMAGPMLRPTADQIALMGTGTLTTVGAHTIGAPDGGPGLPITGWSTVAGDVRAPHFFGLHGLQVIPLLGWIIVRRRRFNPGEQLALVGVGGVGYLAFTSILFWQALRGESVVAPGAGTLTALAVLLVATVSATGAVMLHARRNSVQASLAASAIGQVRHRVAG